MAMLCKNCPFKNAKKEVEGHCTDLFVKKYHNSCVTYDADERFMEELVDFMEAREETLT